MLSKKLTLSLLMTSMLVTSVQAQPKIDPLTRVAFGTLGLIMSAIAYEAGKNTQNLVEDFVRDPRASNTYWNLRAGVAPIVPMILSSLICATTATVSTACAIQAITGKDILRLAKSQITNSRG